MEVLLAVFQRLGSLTALSFAANAPHSVLGWDFHYFHYYVAQVCLFRGHSSMHTKRWRIL